MRTHEDWLAIIAHNVVRLQKANDMTAERLSKRIGMNPATISMVRNGRLPNLGLGTLMKLARGLEVELIELFKPSADVRYTYKNEPRYLTFSQWFWERFYRDAVPFGGGELSEEAKRSMFEAFLKAARPDYVFSESEREGIWNDRAAFQRKEDTVGNRVP